VLLLPCGGSGYITVHIIDIASVERKKVKIQSEFMNYGVGYLDKEEFLEICVKTSISKCHYDTNFNFCLA
jgi:hypothetical protein